MKQDEIVAVFMAIANGFRLDILRYLAASGDEPVQPSTLVEHFKVTKSNVSFHLMQLLNAGLVAQRRKGQHHYYSINNEKIKAVAGFLLAEVGSMPPAQEQALASSRPSSFSEIAVHAAALAEKTNEANFAFQERLADDLAAYLEAERALRAEGKLSPEKARFLRRNIMDRLIDADKTMEIGAQISRAVASGDPAACAGLAKSLEKKS